MRGLALTGMAAVVLSACGGHGRGGTGMPDASTDTSVDRTIYVDTGLDLGGDVGSPDSGTDFGVVILPDLGHDMGRDLGRDAGRDFGTDFGTTTSCYVGRACDPVVGCNGGMQCQAEIDQTETIYSSTGTTTTETLVFYPGGYCTNATLSSPSALAGSAGACDLTAASDDPAMATFDGCLACAKCIDLGASSSAAGAAHLVQCAERCTPTDVDNDICRDGYQCAPDSHTCTFGECATDTDCRTYVEDTNGDGTCSTASGDHVVIDAASDGTCDPATYRCHRSGTPGAHAGDPCTVDSQCEADGRCLDECQFSTFVGGYCTKNFCDVPGRACASGDTCFDAGAGFFLCLESCTVDAEAMSLWLGTGGHGDTCDVGYACSYDNVSPVGAAGNGGCLPGNYNAVTTPNVGHACSSNDTCYSPHGVGQCIFASPSSACSILGCAGYPASENVCGAGAACFSGFADGSSTCLATCTTPADCTAAGAPADHACIQLSAADPQRYCWPACMMDSDCQTGHTCVGATTTGAGTCM